MDKWRIVASVVIACLLTAVMLSVGVYTNYYQELDDTGCEGMAGCPVHKCYLPSNSFLLVITAPISSLTMFLQGALLTPMMYYSSGPPSKICIIPLLMDWTYPVLQFPYYFAISYFLLAVISKAKIFGKGKQDTKPKPKT